MVCSVVRSALRSFPSRHQRAGDAGEEGFCRLGALCFSSYSSSLALAVFWRCALWCVHVARAMRTVCCSCLSIERSRRSRRRWATAPTGGRRLDSSMHGHAKENN